MEMPGIIRRMTAALSKSWDRLANFLWVSEKFPAAFDQSSDVYKQETVCYTDRTDKDVAFRADLATGASSNYNLTGLNGNKIRVKRIGAQMVAGAARAFEVWLFRTDTFQNADLDLDSGMRMTSFPAAGGIRANSGAYPQWYWDSGALDQIYEDLDGTNEAHIALVWRDATGYDPTAPGTDMIILEIDYEVMA